MTAKDTDYIAKIEKAIAQKYGEEATHNPRRFWNEDKEQEYIEQSQAEQKKFAKLAESQDKVEEDGFLINKNYLLESIIGRVLFVKNILFVPRTIYT